MPENAQTGTPDPAPGPGAREQQSYRLPPSSRLRDSGTFRHVFDNGLCLRGRFMVAWGLCSEAGEWRLGVVASRRTFRRAVDRNRGKRLVREAFRLNRSRFDGGGDLVIVCRRAILDVNAHDVSGELNRLMRRMVRQNKGTDVS